MPSGYLHEACARRACDLSGITPAHMDLMVLGAQGPDPLFTLGLFPLRPSSLPSTLGKTLHTRRTGAFLLRLLAHAKAMDGRARAYALGFLTHYALDSTVHPYVYALSTDEAGGYSSLTHVRIEKNWDTLYYRRDGHAGTPRLMQGVAQTRADWDMVADLLSRTITAVFPEEKATPGDMLRALESSHKANRLTYSPRGVKYALAGVLERLMGRPGLATSQMPPARPVEGGWENEAHATWYSPYAPGEVRSESLSELFDRGVSRAAELISAAARYFGDEMDAQALSIVIGDLGYDSGTQSLP